MNQRSQSVEGQPDPESGAGGAWATFRVQGFAALWTSNLLHQSAWHAQLLILQWLVTSLTDSRALIGLVGFMQGASMFVMSPLAGVASDRMPRRALLIATRLGVAVAVAGISVLIALENTAVWPFLVVAAIFGALSALMQPASQTLVYDIVPRSHAEQAISINAAATGLAQTAGPLAAGVALVSLGFFGSELSVAAGVTLSAALLLAVPVVRMVGDRATSHWLEDLREGLQFAYSTPPVRWALVACAMSIFNGAHAVMRPVFARHVLEVGAGGYGALAGAAGAGGILAAIILATRGRLPHPGLWIVGTMWCFAVVLILYSFAFSFNYLLVIEFLSGIVGQFWMVATFTGIQLGVPEHMRGRIMSLVFMLVMLAPVGGVFIGLLADRIGDQWALGLFGAIPCILLMLLFIFARKELRSL